MLGVVDQAHRLFPLMWAVSNYEESEFATIGLLATANLLHVKLTGESIRLSRYMGDAGLSLRQAVQQFNPDVEMGMCFKHMLDAVRKSAKIHNLFSKLSIIEKDVLLLSRVSRANIAQAWVIWKREWPSRVTTHPGYKAFVEYFE